MSAGRYHPLHRPLGVAVTSGALSFISFLATLPAHGEDKEQDEEVSEGEQDEGTAENMAEDMEAVLLRAAREFGEELSRADKEGLSAYVTPSEPFEVVTENSACNDKCRDTRRFSSRQAFFRWLDTLPLDPDDTPFNPLIVGESGQCKGNCCSLWSEDGALHFSISLYMVCFVPYGDGHRIGKIGLSYD